jgi:cell division protein FtsQ
LILTPLTILLVVAIYFMTPLARVGDLSVRGESTLPAQSVIDASKLGSSQMILDLLLHKKQRGNAGAKGLASSEEPITLSVQRLQSSDFACT